ncbi:hypothetical protein A1O1_05210, partial [Capronia coronata CBS 617.96]
MITQTSLTTAFYDDPFERPSTPPDSPLRDTFCPKEVTHLHHIAPPPGIEPAKDCRGHPLELDETNTNTNTNAVLHRAKPQVPPKPRELDFFVSNGHVLPRHRSGGSITEYTAQFPTQHLARHQACLHQREFCLRFDDTDDLNKTCCHHRHETLYKHELRGGVPVEIFTHTCEISHPGTAQEQQEEEEDTLKVHE